MREIKLSFSHTEMLPYTFENVNSKMGSSSSRIKQDSLYVDKHNESRPIGCRYSLPGSTTVPTDSLICVGCKN